ncbi:glycosyltransferase [Candidatus Aerophobetes bacterium]|nr:glycosyltransferase [Candidatus Aerophobetes bacterium]
MSIKNVLFISGSVGLGHVTRDIAIANELRRKFPQVKIFWLTSHPATEFLKTYREKILPESNLLDNHSEVIEQATNNMHINLLKYAIKGKNTWRKNFEVFAQVVKNQKFDLWIGDESYEITNGLSKNYNLKKAPYVAIFDFLGLDSMSYNPLEVIGIYYLNRIWLNMERSLPPVTDLRLFVGTAEDIPDKSFGLFLPNRREFAKKYYKFIGYVLRFNPDNYRDKNKIKNRLGYKDDPLVVAAIGGTSAGKKLLEICIKSYPLIKKKIPNLKMLLVCGPRVSSENLKVPNEVEVKGYIPNLFEYYAACDLAVVTGGFTTTLELTALKKPFIYFPLEHHCEQQIYVKNRLERWNAGIRMSYSTTTPEELAEKVITGIETKVNYADIPVDGAKKAAKYIMDFLK